MKRLLFIKNNLSQLPTPDSSGKYLGVDNGGVLSTIDDQGSIEPVGGGGGGFEYDITFTEIEQNLQLFTTNVEITQILKTTDIDSISYNVDGGSFTNITLPLSSSISINAGQEVIWQVSYATNEDKGCLTFVGNNI